VNYVCPKCGTERDRTKTRDCLRCKSDRRRVARSGPDGDAVRRRAAEEMRAWRAKKGEDYRRYERERQTSRRERDNHAARERRRRGRKSDVHVEDVEPLVVLEMHDGVCGLCGGDVDPLRFDVDHIIPIARGGEHSYANTQPAHPSCNYSKQDRYAFA
jgi:5-methylcytosine-specific restriction endonuclease McrA